MPDVGAGRLTFEERWEVVAGAIRQLIFDGDLPMGARLSENELADRFGVSRGPIREALRALEIEGLVVRKQRHGSFVTSFTRKDVEEIYSIRSAVEPLAAERSFAQRMALQERLNAPLGEMERALRANRPKRIISPDMVFHGAFYELADHDRLLAIWRSLEGPVRMLINFTLPRTNVDTASTRSAHQAIYNAVAADDLAGCQRAIADHITDAWRIARDRIE